MNKSNATIAVKIIIFVVDLDIFASLHEKKASAHRYQAQQEHRW
jgi:hypothetical protein